MKIIEGLKRLNVIMKRMDTNSENITNYASMLSNERPVFGTETEQRKEVSGRIQANQDLFNEYLKLKRRIDITNLRVKVQFDGIEYSLADLLVIKRDLAKKMLDTYNALNDTAARGRQSRQTSQTQDGKPVFVERMYDEKMKNAGLDKWQDLYNNIESRLEVVNASTDLVEESDV